MHDMQVCESMHHAAKTNVYLYAECGVLYVSRGVARVCVRMMWCCTYRHERSRHVLREAAQFEAAQTCRPPQVTSSRHAPYFIS